MTSETLLEEVYLQVPKPQSGMVIQVVAISHDGGWRALHKMLQPRTIREVKQIAFDRILVIE